MVGRDEAKGAAATAELRALGARAAFIAADVVDEAACRAMIAGTVEALGRLV